MRSVMRARASIGIAGMGFFAAVFAGMADAQQPDPGNQASAAFHVAVDGRDTNPGSATAPFGTLARAQAAVRALVRKGLTRDVVVEVHAGTYPITAPLAFGPEDSGTREFAVVYTATPGAQVVLDGGRRIDGWKRGPGDVWTAFVPDAKAGAWYPRQLFVDGQRAIPWQVYPGDRNWFHSWGQVSPLKRKCHRAGGDFPATPPTDSQPPQA
jgi:hypothetical protein